MSIMRTIGMVAFGVCTLGFGFLYIWARTRWIEPGNVGIVINYGKDKAEIEKLDPGVHVVMSPFRSFKSEISTQTQAVKLKQFEVKTKDNFDALVQADYWYQVKDPDALILNVKDGEQTLRTTAESALASVLQEYDYQDFTSGSIDRDNQPRSLDGSGNGTTASLTLALDDAKSKSSGNAEQKRTSNSPSSGWNEISQKFIEKLKVMCAGWGVEFFGFQLVSVEVEQDHINKEIAQATLVDYQNRSRLKASRAKADAVLIEAEGEAKARERLAQVEVERAKACKSAAAELKDNPDGLAVYQACKKVEIAQAISQGGRNVNITALGGEGENSFAAAPFAFMPAPAAMGGERGVQAVARVAHRA